jgi:Glycosyl transferase family 2
MVFLDMTGRLSYPLMMIRRRTDQVRRRLEQLADQMATIGHRAVFGSPPVPPFDGEPRLAIVTVNFSTTRWLKLMLLTLAGQEALDRVTDIVIVDNDSRDGGAAFVRKLGQRIERVRVVENRHFLCHARGMRLGIGQLDVGGSQANVILALDTDVVFLRPDTLTSTLAHFAQGAALVGEMRDWVYDEPEAQASFVAFRRDVYARRETAPWVNHGAPSYWMQKSIRRAGHRVVDFQTYQAGYALHRGRAGVRAAGRFRPSSSYASVQDHNPHFMGVPGGEELWQRVEDRWRQYLEPEAESALLDLLSNRLAGGQGAPA